LFPVFGIHIERYGRLDIVGEKIIDELLFIRVALGYRAMLRGDALGADQFAARAFFKSVLPEFKLADKYCFITGR